MKFVLVGAHAGKTVTLGGHPFVDGVFEYGPNADNVAPSDLEKARKANLLSKMYQAYPEGSDELKKAQARVKGGEAPEDELDVAKREQEAEANRQPSGAGGTDRARLGAVRTAITKLNADDDNHWTTQGLPSVEAVRELSGDKDVSRQDISNLAPKLNREEAKKLKENDPLA